MKNKQNARQYFREWRKFRGKSQQQAAEAVGVEQPTISRLETGEIKYTQEMIERLAELYGCRPEDLLSVNPASENRLRAIYSELEKAAPDIQKRAVTVIEALLIAG